MLIVKVVNGKIEYALKKYKQKTKDTKIHKELRERMHYTKKSMKKRIAKNKAIRKNKYEE